LSTQASANAIGVVPRAAAWAAISCALRGSRTRGRRPRHGVHAGRNPRLALALGRLALDHRVERQRKASAA
ncbi:hypothetical protein ACQCR0_22145, partial [Ralstonia pseudosolanacearum]|uniref:hypothetical protein n=1 Tax=Ralstonia pseudosolanacearum TaxID=1310165 RepID=UPI003CEBB706